MNTSAMQIRLPRELHAWLKVHAAKNKISMTDIVVTMLETLRRRIEKTGVMQI